MPASSAAFERLAQALREEFPVLVECDTASMAETLAVALSHVYTPQAEALESAFERIYTAIAPTHTC